MGTETLNRILFVEDDSDIQEVASTALELIGGFQITLASSGVEALKKAPEAQPQLILLDVMMPEMDGPTTLEALRKQTMFADTPVVFMTAKVQPHEVAEYKALGALDVISKPFDPMSLSSKIEQIWQESLKTNPVK